MAAAETQTEKIPEQTTNFKFRTSTGKPRERFHVITIYFFKTFSLPFVCLVALILLSKVPWASELTDQHRSERFGQIYRQSDPETHSPTEKSWAKDRTAVGDSHMKAEGGGLLYTLTA